ncbi:sugar efflux transporter [Metabacillus niabensis]|uniref:sugar efflux transporter n=1 Tax=Metabacillus niabensis TaxID=324854 RepID=UPI001CF9B7C9|nr:sugar efflux transporter [Metabacillus niabensis]
MLSRMIKLFEIKGYRLFVICMLLVGIGISITLPYVSLYLTEDVGISAGAFGVFMAITSLGGILVNSFIAKRSDSGLDRKMIIIIAMLSSALGYASYLVFNHFLVLLLVMTTFNGIGAAAMPQIYAYAQESANSSKSEDKTFAMSTLRSLVSLGFLIGPLGGTVLLSAFGYDGLFMVTAFIFLTVATLVFLFLQKRSINKVRPSNMKNPLVKKMIRMPFIAFILLFAVNASNMINTPLFIVNVLQGTHRDVGLVVGICAGLEIPIMLLLGAFAQKISNQTLMVSGCVIGILYFSILSFSTHPWQLIVAQLLQATYVAIIMGNGLSYFSDLLPNSPGMSATIYSNGSTIGRLLGSLGGGMIAQYAGFRIVNWVCLMILGVSLLILWRVKSQEKLATSLNQTPSV